MSVAVERDLAPVIDSRGQTGGGLRSLLRRSPRLYAWSKRMYGAARYWLRRPHEAEFAFFRHFDGQHGLFVDIGANTGQSARSLRIFNRTLEILSFEPNRLLEPDLRFTRRLLGRGFRYELCGLGDRDGQFTLYVPMIGGTPHSPWASIDREILEQNRRQIEDELGRKFEVAQVTVQVRRLDDFGLSPIAVKLDVEGLEVHVLCGMDETLRQHRPLLMVESNASEPDVRRHLGSRGYRFFQHDAARRLLSELRDETEQCEGTNYFAVHESRLERLAQLPGLRVAMG